MRNVDYSQKIPWPSMESPVENFTFDCVCTPGTLTFHFKWLNDRWNLWVTLPDGSIREAGVQPNVVSWSGHTDYGIYFISSLETIDFDSLFLTELYLIVWE